MKNIEELLRKKIVVLDGAMGTCIMDHHLSEGDFAGDCGLTHKQKGNNDILNITNPAVIKAVHMEYLKAGADIIETNTFNATRISQRDYETEELVYEINFKGAQIAKECIQEFERLHPSETKFLAGSIGPTNRMASMSPDLENPGFRNVSFEQMVEAYTEQIRGLVDGGVDILLIETVYDGLNGRAAIFAADTVLTEKNLSLPVMVSGTIADKAGESYLDKH